MDKITILGVELTQMPDDDSMWETGVIRGRFSVTFTRLGSPRLLGQLWETTIHLLDEKRDGICPFMLPEVDTLAEAAQNAEIILEWISWPRPDSPAELVKVIRNQLGHPVSNIEEKGFASASFDVRYDSGTILNVKVTRVK